MMGLILAPTLLSTTVMVQAKGIEAREEMAPDGHERADFPVTDQSRSQSAQARWSVEYKGGHLSVSAEQAPLAQVLREVARQADVEVQGLERLEEKISLRFTNLSLREGLQELLASVNYLLIEDTFPQGEAQPTRILVFGRLTVPSLQARQAPASEEENIAPEDEEQEERLIALETFAQQGDEAALRDALSDPDERVRTRALELLALRDQQLAVSSVLELMKSDQVAIRSQALRLLHETGYADEGTIVSALGEALTDQAVRDYAIQALAERGGADALNYLRQAYHDPDPTVRRLVIESVAPLGHGRSLLQEAAVDPDESVRSFAAFWLQEIDFEEEGNSENDMPLKDGFD